MQKEDNMSVKTTTSVWVSSEQSFLCQHIAALLDFRSTSLPSLLGQQILDNHFLVSWNDVAENLVNKSGAQCHSEFNRLAGANVPHSIVLLITSHLERHIEIPVHHRTNGTLRALAQEALGTKESIHLELRDGQYTG